MSGKEAAIDSPITIPLWRTLAAAYGTLVRNLWPFVQIAAFPLALGVLLSYLWHELYGPLYDFLVPLIGSDTAFVINSKKPQWFVEQIVDWLVLVLFMSHWLQFLAAKERSRKPKIVWAFSRADPRVLRYGLLLTTVPLCSIVVRLLVYSPANSVESFVKTVDIFQMTIIMLVPASVVVDCLVAGRSAPIFAAAADGQKMTLRNAWQATRHQTLPLMLAWFVLFLLTRLLAAPMQSVADELYATVIIPILLPDDFPTRFFLPPFDQLRQLPSAMMQLAAMALGAFVFHRLYWLDAKNRNALLDRFD